MKKPTISVLIPAYNEEKGIEKCIISCLNQSVPIDEVLVVNDGSTDNTLKILDRLGKKVGERLKIVNLAKNTGNKSKAQEIGLRYINTDIFITTDADTILDRDFVKEILIEFQKDRRLVAITGFVESLRDNWVTRVREINYIIGQTIYKRAQSMLGALFVLAGCATAFKTEEFRKHITFEHDNITEDLDFTYKFKLKDKRIGFSQRAIVYTQDPNNLKSYFRQLYRWYSGGWTCLRKNLKILNKPNNALVLGLIYLEGLMMGGLFLLSPILLFISWKYYLEFLALQLFIVVLSMLYGIIKFRRYDLFLYIIPHYFLGLCDISIFIYTF